ncbi:MAG TPA: hypothetical protein VM368_02180, partial [Flavisolibacter sp.]|nr:hypothetical protein [Flavisolibacter sp.]
RYSWYAPGGTARIQAIGGANGSLGGDISATFINPAGLGFYKTGDFVFTPSYFFEKTKATYLGRTENQQTRKFTLNTSGVVFGSGGNGDVRGGAISLAFNRTADFNNNVMYRGQNNQSSYSQKFLEEIRNGNIKDANRVASGFPFGTSLAFNTYWIDTVGGGSSNNFQFKTRAPISTGLLQQNTLQTKGGINEFALALAVNMRDKLMIGGTLGVPILNFERSGEYVEADATTNMNNNFNYAMVQENLTTSGVGLNLKAGIIYKPQESWRLGLAIHSPTMFMLTDKYSTTITTDTENYKGTQTQSSDFVAGSSGEFKYQLFTPYRVIGSVSYVLREIEDVRRQKGFISADIEYVNYAASSFEPDEESINDQGTRNYLNSLNNAVDRAHKGALNFRVGGELKFTTLMVRAGAAYYGNPYRNINGENGNRLNLSGGLGYRNKGVFVDLTYVHAMTKDVNFAYRLESSPYFGANLKSTRGNALLTIGFKI